MNPDMINGDLFGDITCIPDDSNWLESDDIADDNLRSSFRQQQWLDDDELLLSCDASQAVDRYLGRLRAAAWLPSMWEVR